MRNHFQFLWMYLSILSATINTVYSEEPAPNESPIQLEEIAVTATRLEKETFRTPNTISVVQRPQIERVNADITPRILRETVGVWAQQTTVGQGSPLLRGLTGYQAFIQVDGVRLNNSTFRSGPNQYLSTISSDNLDRIEVLRGPGSMLYGSGAMGGVISLFTKDPTLDGTSESWIFQSRLFGRYASATQERLGRLELTGTHNRLGFAVGASARRFGDLDAGSGYDLHYKNRKFEIVTTRPAGVELFEDPPRDVPEKWLIDTQAPLGWKAYDGDAKIACQLNDNSTINLSYQLWRQPETPRYDKISTGEFDVFAFAPQNRDLVYATYLTKQVGAIEQLRFTTSYHRQKEGRNAVKRDASERRERFDTVNTFGVNAQAMSTALPRQRVVFGGEFYLDTLDSRTVKTDLDTGAETVDEDLGRFIDGSQFWDANLFLQDEIELHDQVELTLGGRLTLFHTNADLSLRKPSFDEFDESGNALTGSAGVVVGVADGLNLVGNVATSFRAPSLNDTTAVEVTNEGIDAPSPNLDPETGWTVEGGFKARYPQFIGSATLFHSRINDLVTRVPVEEVYNGQTLPKLYRDIQSANPGIEVSVFDNVDKVQIEGIEFAGLVPIRSGWSIYGNGMFTRGKVLLLNGAAPNPENPWEERIRREPPLNGMLGVRWEPPEGQFWGGFFVRGAVKQDRLSHGDIRDPRIPGKTPETAAVQFDEKGRAIDAGTPGWFTLNLRGGARLTEYNRLTVALENLLDKRYREHGSGVNAPGFNVIVSLDNRF